MGHFAQGPACLSSLSLSVGHSPCLRVGNLEIYLKRARLSMCIVRWPKQLVPASEHKQPSPARASQQQCRQRNGVATTRAGFGRESRGGPAGGTGGYPAEPQGPNLSQSHAAKPAELRPYHDLLLALSLIILPTAKSANSCCKVELVSSQPVVRTAAVDHEGNMAFKIRRSNQAIQRL